jgi:hypothetical protein
LRRARRRRRALPGRAVAEDRESRSAAPRATTPRSRRWRVPIGPAPVGTGEPILEHLDAAGDGALAPFGGIVRRRRGRARVDRDFGPIGVERDLGDRRRIRQLFARVRDVAVIVVFAHRGRRKVVAEQAPRDRPRRGER